MTVWQQYSTRFLTLKLRERRWVIYGTVLLLWYGLVFFVAEPLWQQRQQLALQNQQKSQQLQALQQQTAEVQLALQQDPDEQLRQEIARLTDQEQQQTTQIRALTGRYISASQMLQLLQDLLAAQPEVQLLTLDNLAAEAVQLPGVVSAKPLLYRHRTQLRFRGSYPALQQLLSDLEQLPWQLHWRQLDYQVQQYPDGEMLLELETVSEYDSYLKI